MSIRFTSFPRTRPSPAWTAAVVDVFRAAEASISTLSLPKGLQSDAVLAHLRERLIAIGFEVEVDKTGAGKLARPVFFGEGDEPTLRYEIDAYHPVWKAGLEVEAGRAIMGNAVFRDLFQAMVMVDVDHLFLAVPNSYAYNSGGKAMKGKDYIRTCAIADALYGHDRVRMPYSLTVIGY